MACERAFPKVIGALAILLLVTCSPAEVAAQDTGCLLQPTGIPPRQVIRCRGGLTVEAAAGSDYTLVDHGRDGIRIFPRHPARGRASGECPRTVG